MAAVASISTWHVREGKTQDFLAVCGKAKKIQERLGAKVRVWSSTFGGQPGTMGYVMEFANWTAFGAFFEKIGQDSEWLSLVTEFGAHPPADLVQQSVVAETPGI